MSEHMNEGVNRRVTRAAERDRYEQARLARLARAEERMHDPATCQGAPRCGYCRAQAEAPDSELDGHRFAPVTATAAELALEVDPPTGIWRLDGLARELAMVSGRWSGFTGDELVMLDIIIRRDCRRDRPSRIGLALADELEGVIDRRLAVNTQHAAARKGQP